MLLQHIVQVAIQREFVLTDNLHYPGYTLVKLLADIHRFAASGIGGGVPDKKTLVILAFPSFVAGEEAASPDGSDRADASSSFSGV